MAKIPLGKISPRTCTSSQIHNFVATTWRLLWNSSFQMLQLEAFKSSVWLISASYFCNRPLSIQVKWNSLELTISSRVAMLPPTIIPSPIFQSGKNVATKIRNPHKGLLTKAGYNQKRNFSNLPALHQASCLLYSHANCKRFPKSNFMLRFLDAF